MQWSGWCGSWALTAGISMQPPSVRALATARRGFSGARSGRAAVRSGEDGARRPQGGVRRGRRGPGRSLMGERAEEQGGGPGDRRALPCLDPITSTLFLRRVGGGREPGEPPRDGRTVEGPISTFMGLVTLRLTVASWNDERRAPALVTLRLQWPRGNDERRAPAPIPGPPQRRRARPPVHDRGCQWSPTYPAATVGRCRRGAADPTG